MLSSLSGPSIATSGSSGEDVLQIAGGTGVRASRLRERTRRVDLDHSLPGADRFGIAPDPGQRDPAMEETRLTFRIELEQSIQRLERLLRTGVIQQGTA